jgi:hypothetical protein
VTDAPVAQPRARALATLEAFVHRARRVTAHSLLTDMTSFEDLMKTTWHVTLNPSTGATTVTRRLPPEESVESLAARVRPLILQNDPVHHGKVLNALGFLLKDVDEVEDAKAYVEWLRDRWRSINSSSDEIGAYSIQKGRVDGTSRPSVIADTILAFGWFYGDVVHADEDRRRATAEFSVLDRYEAAVPVVAKAAWLAHATLDFVEQLRAAGHLAGLGDDAFTTDVVVTVTEIVEDAAVFMAPEHAAPPASLTDDFSQEWQQLGTIVGGGVEDDGSARNDSQDAPD